MPWVLSWKIPFHARDCYQVSSSVHSPTLPLTHSLWLEGSLLALGYKGKLGTTGPCPYRGHRVAEETNRLFQGGEIQSIWELRTRSWGSRLIQFGGLENISGITWHLRWADRQGSVFQVWKGRTFWEGKQACELKIYDEGVRVCVGGAEWEAVGNEVEPQMLQWRSLD